MIPVPLLPQCISFVYRAYSFQTFRRVFCVIRPGPQLAGVANYAWDGDTRSESAGGGDDGYVEAVVAAVVAEVVGFCARDVGPVSRARGEGDGRYDGGDEDDDESCGGDGCEYACDY